MADAIPITRARASNPDLSEVFDLFDAVVDSLARALELEEDLQGAMLLGHIHERDSAAADAAMITAFKALEHAVAPPSVDEPSSARILCSALHTLHLALVAEEARDRAAALALACRHPALQPLGSAWPEGVLVDERLDRLRALTERLGVLTVEADDVPTASPGFDL